MAEMTDLAKALDKLEVTKKPEEEKASPPAEQPTKPAEEASPPASSDKPAQESSPPASSDKQEDQKSPPPDKEEPSAQPNREEVTHKLGSSAAKDSSPPESKQPTDPADDDLLEFTSATDGEASSSAWELVPDKKIARKKGVKSDSEIDSLLKKVIKEAEEPEKGEVTPKDVTSSGTSVLKMHPHLLLRMCSPPVWVAKISWSLQPRGCCERHPSLCSHNNMRQRGDCIPLLNWDPGDRPRRSCGGSPRGR